MNFISNIDSKQFNEFIINHQKSHFLQTSHWGDFKKEMGWNYELVGLTNDEGIIVAGAMLLSRKVPFTNRIFYYAPRGYVIDYNNRELVKIFTEELKKFAKSKKAIFIRIDPDVKLQELKPDGQVIPDGLNNFALVEYLKDLGYLHKGFNKGFENELPRYTFRLDIDRPLDEIRKGIDPKTIKAIDNAISRGVEVFKGSNEDMKTFSHLMSITGNRDNFVSFGHNYYNTYYNILHKAGISELFLARINVDKLINTTEEKLEAEKSVIKQYDEKIEAGASKKIHNKRKESELIIARLNKELDEAKALKSKYPNGVITSGIIANFYGDKAWTIHGGNDDIFRKSDANHLVYYKIIEEGINRGFKKIDFFGTTGDIEDKNQIFGIHFFKKRFGGEYTEFIGEFDLVISNPYYFMFTNLVPKYHSIKRKIRKLRQK